MGDKSTWWSITAYNEEIAYCENSSNYPPFVRKVMGGREKCPTTGTEHFQGALQCTTQVRRSQIKSWLKTAHLEPAQKAIALQKYAMKEETAIGDKLDRINENPYYSADKICELIATEFVINLSEFYSDTRQTDKFWFAVRKILITRPQLAGQLMNPSLRNFFNKTDSVWITRAQKMNAVHSITCPVGEISFDEI